jgi:hypothetical protein
VEPVEPGAEGAVPLVVGAAITEVWKVLGKTRLGRAEAVLLPPGAAVAAGAETTGALEMTVALETGTATLEIAVTLEAGLALVATAALEAAAAAEVAGVVLLEAGLDETGVVEPPEPSQLPTGPPGAV